MTLSRSALVPNETPTRRPSHYKLSSPLAAAVPSNTPHSVLKRRQRSFPTAFHSPHYGVDLLRKAGLSPSVPKTRSQLGRTQPVTAEMIANKANRLLEKAESYGYDLEAAKSIDFEDPLNSQKEALSRWDKPICERVTNMVTEIEQLSARVQTSQTDIDNCESANASLESQLDKLAATMETLQQSLAHMEENKESNMRDMVRVQDAKAMLEASLSQIKKDLASHQASHDAYLTHIRSLVHRSQVCLGIQFLPNPTLGTTAVIFRNLCRDNPDATARYELRATPTGQKVVGCEPLECGLVGFQMGNAEWSRFIKTLRNRAKEAVNR